MSDAVTDTHALIWYLGNDPRLSAPAAKYFDDCVTDGGRIRVPSICIAEIVYLSERGRIPTGVLGLFLADLRSVDTILVVSDLSLAVVLSLQKIPRSMVPELPDRIIAATALHLGLPLLTRDAKIQSSGLPTVW